MINAIPNRPLPDILPSASRTTLPTIAKQYNSYHSGLQLFIDVTAAAGAPSLVVTVVGYDPGGADATYTLLASAAITATGRTLLFLHPAATPAANSVASQALPREWGIIVTGTAGTVTYSISGLLVA